VPRPSTLIIAHKLGDEWYALARHPSGQYEHVRRFKTESEAKNWIATARPDGNESGFPRHTGDASLTH
jgi:hypothetical protein